MAKVRVDRVFDKVCTGWVIWERRTTPMEDHVATVFRHACDAEDELQRIYGMTNWREHRWRIQPVTLGARRPTREHGRGQA
jgi:hypothetical protein